MSCWSRATRVALLAALMCASILGGGGASATTMRLEPAGEFTMASSGAVTYSGEGVEFTCNMTLEGLFEATVANVEAEGGTVGQVTGERWAECSGASLLTALRLPLPMRITRTLGTLPSNFTGILYAIANDTLEFTLINGSCLYVRITGTLLAFGGTPPRSRAPTVLGTSYTKVSGGIFCPSTLSRFGAFTLSPTQTASFS